MIHTIREKQKLLARVRRIRGQIEAIERGLENEAGCEQIMHLIAGASGAMAGVMGEVLEDHVRAHLDAPSTHPAALNPDAVAHLLGFVRTQIRRGRVWNRTATSS